MANEKLIEVRNISKDYGSKYSKTKALSNVSFDLEQGQNLAIIGPSGSGKTTLLQIIGGISKPTKGEVIINNKDILNLDDDQASEFRNQFMGFVFQNIYLQNYFTAKENVMLPMLIANKSHKESSRKAEELLELVGLSHRINHKPSELSGGEEQRVAIARALSNDPKLILADEPTAKLDKENRDNILEIFGRVNELKKISIVVITHDESYRERFPNIISLKDGKISN